MLNRALRSVILSIIIALLNCKNFVMGRRSFKVVNNWPEYTTFGQISAVSVDTSDNVYVFHRGDRQWDYRTFTPDNVFVSKNSGPISEDTIVILNSSTGSLITKTGSDLFYLPHGLTIDHENNIWVTDVALHQVFKFPPLKITPNATSKLGKPLLSLGVALEPGNDDSHFCKPTDVAVDKESNDFFVSDGYCNSRILKYNKYGKQILSWGRSTIGSVIGNFMLNVPHSLALTPRKHHTLYVADRENFRIIAYDSLDGTFKKVYDQGINNRTFSVAYYPSLKVDLIFILINDLLSTKLISVQSAQTNSIEFNSFSENYLTNPHDIALDTNGTFCYIVELNPYKIWKFEIDQNGISTEEEADISDGKPSSNASGNVNDPVKSTEQSQTDRFSSTNQSEGTNTYLAVGLVAFVIIVSFIFFMFHFSRRKEYKRYEMKRLILDDEDDYMGGGGIRLT